MAENSPLNELSAVSQNCQIANSFLKSTLDTLGEILNILTIVLCLVSIESLVDYPVSTVSQLAVLEFPPLKNDQ